MNISKKIIATLSAIALTAGIIGCEKTEPTLTNPNLEQDLSQDPTLDSDPSYTITLPQRSSTDDDSRYNWEDSVRSVVIMAYNAEDINPSKLPRIVYEFNQDDLTARTSVIPATDKEIANEILDFYALVNCKPLLPDYTDLKIPHDELLQITDSEVRYKYNSLEFNQLETTITNQGGFPMTASTKAVAPNQGNPVSVSMSCGRVCSKIDVQLQTVDIDFTADVTSRGTPHATIIMRHAVLTRNNREVYIIDTKDRLVDDYLPPFGSTDSLIQENGSNITFFPKNARYIFYTLPTLERGEVHYPFYYDYAGTQISGDNHATKLEIYFDYYPDKNYTYSEQLHYTLPILGGNDQTLAQALNPNTDYTLNIKVIGLGGAYRANGEMMPYMNQSSTSALQQAPLAATSTNQIYIELGANPI